MTTCQGGAVSFDVFLQRFQDGDGAPADPVLVEAVLAPYLDPSRTRLVLPDGEADVYGCERAPVHGLMVNHLSGSAGWDVLHRLALHAGLAVMPVGCPTAVADEAALAHLPEELRGDAVVVGSGARCSRSSAPREASPSLRELSRPAAA